MNHHYVHYISDLLEIVKTYFADHAVHNEITMDLLKHVALARLSLVGAAQLLCCRFLEQYKNENCTLDNELHKVFAHLREIIGDNRNTDAHMFMLRHIIRCHGNRELMKIIEESQFNWLALQTNNENNTV